MYRLPNPFHTPASHAQAASGGGCTSCCCCCVATTIGSSILGAIYFANIKAEPTQNQPQEVIQNTEAPATNGEDSIFPTTENPPDAPALTNTNQASDARVLLGFLGFFALPFALFIAWQVGESSNASFEGALFIAGLVMVGIFALAHHLAGSRPLKGIIIAIAWMIGLALATAFELAIWRRF